MVDKQHLHNSRLVGAGTGTRVGYNASQRHARRTTHRGWRPDIRFRYWANLTVQNGVIRAPAESSCSDPVRPRRSTGAGTLSRSRGAGMAVQRQQLRSRAGSRRSGRRMRRPPRCRTRAGHRKSIGTGGTRDHHHLVGIAELRSGDHRIGVEQRRFVPDLERAGSFWGVRSSAARTRRHDFHSDGRRGPQPVGGAFLPLHTTGPGFDVFVLCALGRR